MRTIAIPSTNHFPAFDKEAFMKKIFLFIISWIVIAGVSAQADKKIMLADKYYAAGEYLTAASLYGQFLHPVQTSKAATGFPLNNNRNNDGQLPVGSSKTDILLKQAHSYRLANYLNEAIQVYKQCIEADGDKYGESLYWLAVCYRSIGNYTAAEEAIDRFLKDHASGTSYGEAATKEKEVIQYNKAQFLRPDTGLYHVQKLNSSFGPNNKGVFAAVPMKGNQFIVTSTQKDSVAADQNPYYNRLFTAGFSINGIDHIEPLNMESAGVLVNQGAAALTPDGKRLYFTQWTRENNGIVGSIYFSEKTAGGWGSPKSAGLVNKQNTNNLQPFISPDGKHLFFASDRKGGFGKLDIWSAPLNADGTTGEAVNLGAVVNSAADEEAPFYHANSSTLVFASDRLPSMGGLDLFTSRRTGTEWQQPENMGHPVNSSRDDIYFYSTGSTLLENAYLSSDRGSECCMATYTATKAEKKKMIAGVVYDCKDNQPLTGAVVIMTDKNGKAVYQTTGADGRYSFELTDEHNTLTVQKEKYNDRTTAVQIEKANQSHWQTDTLYNTALCVEKKLVIKVENVVTVYFDFDKHNLKDLAVAKLDSIHAVLNSDTSYTIQISGYTDGLGTVEYNKILSDKRAKACADYLISKGLDSTRISFESFGACCPIEMELINGRDNPDGRSMNRRALININKNED